jgi:hypothetical protein
MEKVRIYISDISQDSVVGIVTHSGLDGPGLEPGWGQEVFFFSYSSIPALSPTQSPLQRVPGLFLGSKPA